MKPAGEEGVMNQSERLIIVQRHQERLFAALRRRYAGTAEVLFDRRRAERRRGGPHEGVERRASDRRRSLQPPERAAWTDLRHLQVIRAGAAADLSGYRPSRDSLSP
jgi:hypothetical protein